jgi:hypothetical protein
MQETLNLKIAHIVHPWPTP